MIIPTARLDLVLQTPDEVLAWLDTLPPADRAEVSPDWIAKARTTAVGDYWALMFTVRLRDHGPIGGCGFKGPPDEHGIVELAYGIDAEHQSRGYASEAAAALAEFAFATGKVQTIRAHTKTDNGASAKALAKCGFTKTGEVIEPEDGLVDRWELQSV